MSLAPSPEIAVVVPSHDRPSRLRFLLNALEEQSLSEHRFEVVVAHDSRGPETDRLLREHPLARGGRLRPIAFAPGAGPAEKRNAGWRAALAPIVAFTDDDCRPPVDWLERLLEACGEHPGAMVQGATRPDPDEAGLLNASPSVRSQHIDPPTVWGQTCNIAYPKALLERTGGFDESLPVASGEDVDLALRAIEAGAELVPAPGALTYHAVEAFALGRRLHATWRWQHLALVAKRHRGMREVSIAGVFWKPTHATFLLGLAGAALAFGRRDPRWSALALPWAAMVVPRYGTSPRGLARSVLEMPGKAAFEALEVAALARGSVRYRTLYL